MRYNSDSSENRTHLGTYMEYLLYLFFRFCVFLVFKILNEILETINLQVVVR